MRRIVMVRNEGQSLVIDGLVTIDISQIFDGKLVLTIRAPGDVSIEKEEHFLEMMAEDRAA
jgi:sRNA-binding carbon storage regulator CsrA